MARDSLLQRTYQLDGEETGFLCEILSTRPVASLASLVRLGQETADFFDQIVLRSAQLLIGGLLKILLRGANVFVRLVGVGSLVIRRHFGRYLGRGRTCLLSRRLGRLWLRGLFTRRRSGLRVSGS